MHEAPATESEEELDVRNFTRQAERLFSGFESLPMMRHTLCIFKEDKDNAPQTRHSKFKCL